MSCLRPSTSRYLKSGAWILTGLAAAAFVFNPLRAAEPGQSPPLQFNRDIRPILADNCYACHGPDQNQRMAGLRLDLQDSALGRLDSGKLAIVPETRKRASSSGASPPGMNLAKCLRSIRARN